MPTNKESLAHAFNPAVFTRDLEYIFKNSRYIKNRTSTKEMIGALANINQDLDSYTGGIDSGAAISQQMMEGFKKITNAFLLNVKTGDMLAIAGTVPVFSAYKHEFMKTIPEDRAIERAMLKFESAVDRAQQSQSNYGKSYLQSNPLGRLFFSFSSAPTQYYRNTQSSLIEIGRMIKGEGGKGSLPANVFNVLNYGQPSR